MSPSQFSQETKNGTFPLRTDDCKVQYIRLLRCCLVLYIWKLISVRIKQFYKIIATFYPSILTFFFLFFLKSGEKE